MKYRRLGKTELEISEIGLGGLFFTSEGREMGMEIVHRALELGVNFFDTAPPSYRLGKGSVNAQSVLGEALNGVRKRHYVSTKIGPNPVTGKANYDYENIMIQVEYNVKYFRKEYIDVLLIHDPDRHGNKMEPGSLYPVFGKNMALETFEKLKEQGIIGAIGLGSLWLDYQAYCINSRRFDLILTFNRYGLIWRDAQFQLFPFCERHDVGVVQGTPFHQGVLAEPRPEWVVQPPGWMTPEEHDRYRRLLDIQNRSGLPMTELALRFILQNEQISSVIPGVTNIDQLEANVACSEKGFLPCDTYAEIEALGILYYDQRRYI